VLRKAQQLHMFSTFAHVHMWNVASCQHFHIRSHRILLNTIINNFYILRIYRLISETGFVQQRPYDSGVFSGETDRQTMWRSPVSAKTTHGLKKTQLSSVISQSLNQLRRPTLLHG